MKKILLLLSVFLITSCTPADTSLSDAVYDLDGNEVSIDSLIKDSPAVVTFWASWCSFCKAELPLFQEFAAKNPGIQFIGVNLQEDEKVVKEFWSDQNFTFPTLLDPSSHLKNRFEVFTQPTTFFVNKEGVIASLKNGPLTKKDLTQRLSEISTEVIGDLSDRIEVQDQRTDIQLSEPIGVLASWYTGPVKHLIPLSGILSGGPSKDGIPSIDSPAFESALDVGFLEDTDRGLLLTIGSDTRFYPFSILNWHEIVNDEVAGKKVAVTYCPLCDTAVVYDRTTTSGFSEFGVSGLLYKSNMLMYDRNTESLWNQATGEAVVGELSGGELAMLTSDIVHWKTVWKNYPDAKVLSRSTGVVRDYSRDPYEGYESSTEIVFPVGEIDERLHPKERVVGLVIDGVSKAYTKSLLREKGVVEDTIGFTPVRLHYNPTTQEIRIRRLDTETLIPYLPSFWFSWIAQFPESELQVE